MMTHKMFLMAGLIAFIVFSQAAYAPLTYAQGQTLEPGTTFQKAHESFLKKEYKESAAEIRKGANFLKKEVQSANDEGNKALSASIQELGKLADKVEKGAVKSDKELKDSFSRAEHALADNYYLKASESWARKETKETGHALSSAADHIELAAKWSGRKLETGESRAVSLGREVSDKLVQGTGYVSEEVNKSLTSMGDALSGLGKRISSEKQ
ncbi:MAG TPA: hypothetical protein PK350_10975 [Deltaproteobacteria bacterium]|nr:hypothetical protein [Deltaproteobacteria bacterium]HPI93647.1 hypothetical protein [Deltaproteobacteria bacterium]HPR54567.1 hypothetical protein [Deltaproteobacteria bacterium]